MSGSNRPDQRVFRHALTSLITLFITIIGTPLVAHSTPLVPWVPLSFLDNTAGYSDSGVSSLQYDQPKELYRIPAKDLARVAISVVDRKSGVDISGSLRCLELTNNVHWKTLNQRLLHKKQWHTISTAREVDTLVGKVRTLVKFQGLRGKTLIIATTPLLSKKLKPAHFKKLITQGESCGKDLSISVIMPQEPEQPPITLSLAGPIKSQGETFYALTARGRDGVPTFEQFRNRLLSEGFTTSYDWFVWNTGSLNRRALEGRSESFLMQRVFQQQANKGASKAASKGSGGSLNSSLSLPEQDANGAPACDLPSLFPSNDDGKLGETFDSISKSFDKRIGKRKATPEEMADFDKELSDAIRNNCQTPTPTPPPLTPTPTPLPPTPTPTPQTPTPTPVTPTATAFTPTPTPIRPTATPLPPTATPRPHTPTPTPVTPTATPSTPTPTPVTPTATPLPPTATATPHTPTPTPITPTTTPSTPTPTPVTPTATPLPPTATATPHTPTPTPVTPTATPGTPIATPIATETDSPEPTAGLPTEVPTETATPGDPTPTNTPETPTPTDTPDDTPTIDPTPTETANCVTPPDSPCTGSSFHTYICEPGATVAVPVLVSCPGSCVCRVDGNGCDNNLECAAGTVPPTDPPEEWEPPAKL